MKNPGFARAGVFILMRLLFSDSSFGVVDFLGCKALVQCMMESKTKSKYQGIWRLSRRCVLAAPENICKNSKSNSALFYGRSEDAAPTKIHSKVLV